VTKTGWLDVQLKVITENLDMHKPAPYIISAFLLAAHATAHACDRDAFERNYRSGMTSLNDQRYNEAIEAFQRAGMDSLKKTGPFDISCNNAKIEVGLGDAYFEQGKYTDAIDSYDNARLSYLGDKRSLSLAYSGLGAVWAQIAYEITSEKGAPAKVAEDYSKALDFLNRAITEDPSNGKAYTYRGVVYLNQGDINQAQVDCSEGLRRVPGSPVANRCLDAVRQGLRTPAKP
jgi:tetratricopeptide (TPR) repeat protein